MTEAMPNGATPKAVCRHRQVEARRERPAHGAEFPACLSQRYFDAAGFPGRTLGLDADEGKQKTAGK